MNKSNLDATMYPDRNVYIVNMVNKNMIKKIKTWGGSLGILFDSEDLEIYPFIKKGNFVDIQLKETTLSNKMNINFKDKEKIDWIKLKENLDFKKQIVSSKEDLKHGRFKVLNQKVKGDK